MSVTRYQCGTTAYVLDSVARTVFLEENGKLRETGGSYDSTLAAMAQQAQSSTCLDPCTVEEIQKHGLSQALLNHATGVA